MQNSLSEGMGGLHRKARRDSENKRAHSFRSKFPLRPSAEKGICSKVLPGRVDAPEEGQCSQLHKKTKVCRSEDSPGENRNAYQLGAPRRLGTEEDPGPNVRVPNESQKPSG